jgi:hypothetical protein
MEVDYDAYQGSTASFFFTRCVHIHELESTLRAWGSKDGEGDDVGHESRVSRTGYGHGFNPANLVAQLEGCGRGDSASVEY